MNLSEGVAACSADLVTMCWQQNPVTGSRGSRQRWISMFLSLDGIDGVGKSTQVELLSVWLTEQGYSVCCCRDPGTTQLGETLRTIFLKDKELEVSPGSEMLIYMTARAQLVEEIIRPALQSGKLVLSDRFLLANVVYQGHAGQLDPADIWQVGRIATAGLLPDLTIVLDLEAEQGLSRLDGEKDRIESRGREFMEKVRQGFLAEAEQDPNAIKIISGFGSIDDVQQQIRSCVAEFLQQAHGQSGD